MSEKNIPITVHIANKEYKVACPENERDSLIASAREVDQKMREMRNKGKVQSTERIAVITALNLAHELMQSQGTVEHLDRGVSGQLDEMKASIDATLQALNQ